MAIEAGTSYGSSAFYAAAKFRLLGGANARAREFANLSIDQILARVRKQKEKAHQTCIERFRRHGIALETQAGIEAAAPGDLITAGSVADLMAELNVERRHRHVPVPTTQDLSRR